MGNTVRPRHYRVRARTCFEAKQGARRKGGKWGDRMALKSGRERWKEYCMWTGSEKTVIETREGAWLMRNRRAALLNNGHRRVQMARPAPVEEILQPD